VARSHALIEAAYGRFDEALAAAESGLRVHERLPDPFERARTLLVRGVVQRRARQRRAARESLSQALAVFDKLGAPLWSARTRAEIARIGGRAAGNELTPTEAQVAARAAAGETNREIADSLFMSVKTVETNLSRVYRKLDVSSRRQLGPKLEAVDVMQHERAQT
jgi:DNA-binding CsgD family transcriptional regulator